MGRENQCPRRGPGKTGQVLVTLDAREAEAAVAQAKASLEAATARLKQVKATSEETVQSQIQQTKANMDLAQSDLQRAQELHEKNFIARQQLDEARMKYNVAKANLRSGPEQHSAENLGE